MQIAKLADNCLEWYLSGVDFPIDDTWFEEPSEATKILCANFFEYFYLNAIFIGYR